MIQPPAANEGENNWIVLRYADAVLMYAEALNETADTTNAPYLSEPDRSRAGLTSAKSNLTQAALRIQIDKDRRVELCFEGHRWFDLIRKGIEQHGSCNAGTVCIRRFCLYSGIIQGIVSNTLPRYYPHTLPGVRIRLYKIVYAAENSDSNVLLFITTACCYPKVYDITGYGARPDGKNTFTKAIQRAIDDCSKAGGGIVLKFAGQLLPIGTPLSEKFCNAVSRKRCSIIRQY